MSKLIDKLLKNSTTKYTSILSEFVFFNEKDVIPTDIPILNLAFSGDLDGGMSSGLTIFAGPSKTYKTMLMLVCVKAYLEKYKDAACVLYDSEGGITPEYLLSNGIDPKRVVHIPVDHLEMLKFDIVKQLQELERGEKVIFAIDSIGNVASLKELEDALNEKSVAEMQRAKVIKSLFRMITPSLVNKDIPCIAVCHTYETMELYSHAVISGGSGLIYAANQAFIISRAQEKEGTELVGWKFTLNVEKSRFVRERSRFPFVVTYDGGIYKWSSLLDIAIESGHILKNGGWYQVINFETGEVSPDKIRQKDLNSEYFQKLIEDDKFKEFVKSKFAYPQNFVESE